MLVILLILFSLTSLLSWILILVSVAFVSLLERKLIAIFQIRRGPSVAGLWGLLQAFSDFFKLVTSSVILPSFSKFSLYYFSPVFLVLIVLSLGSMSPNQYGGLEISTPLLWMFLLLSFEIYAILWGSLNSGSVYAVLGGYRSMGQTVSYEILLFISAFSFMLFFKAYDLLCFSEVSTPVLILFISNSVLWFVSLVLESARIPFDFMEGESELVSGFNTEYAGMMFTLIFMSEYAKLLLLSYLSAFIFLPFDGALLLLLFLFLFIWVRGTFPRYRFDKMMMLCWLLLLPVAFLVMLFYYLAKGSLY